MSDVVGDVVCCVCLLFVLFVVVVLGCCVVFVDEVLVKIVCDVVGFGVKEVMSKSLVLVKYEGMLVSDGVVFDIILGG